MAFLDVLGKKITQTSQDVVQKTKDTAEVIKLNSTISDEERRIDNLLIQIGKTYLEQHGEEHEEAFESLITEIKEAQAKIEECKDQIQKIKGVCICPNCGEELQLNAMFCSACGSKLEKKEEATSSESATVRYCQACGAPMPDNYVFCINCGAKYEETPTADITVSDENIATESVAEDTGSVQE